MRTLIAFICFLGAASVSADAAFVTNGSFESGINPGSFTSIGSGDTTSITGWTVGGDGVDYIGSLWVAGEGTRSIDLSRIAAGTISQTLQGLSVGTSYNVSFLLAGNLDQSRGDNPNPIKNLLVSAAGQSQSYSFDTTGFTLANMGWRQTSFVFLATDTTAVLTFASQNSNAYGPALDAVNVVALSGTVPEPSSALMLVSGGLGLAIFARRGAMTARV